MAAREQDGHCIEVQQCRLPAAELETQRLSLALLATEEPSLADLRTGKSEARFGHQEILVHHDERRLFLY
jgi:hypothetical protein